MFLPAREKNRFVVVISSHEKKAICIDRPSNDGYHAKEAQNLVFSAMISSPADLYVHLYAQNPGVFLKFEDAVESVLFPPTESEEDSPLSLLQALVDEVATTSQLERWIIGKIDQAIVVFLSDAETLEFQDETCFIDYCLTKCKELNQLKREIQLILREHLS